MNYANIKRTDVSNGTGIRVSLYVTGCRHHCPDCFNPECWDFHYGRPFDSSAEDQILLALQPDYIRGLTLLGGEPLEPENQPGILALIKKVRQAYPKKDIWCYTGFVYEALKGTAAEEILSLVDVLVDGPFVTQLKDLNLRFRGSSNQRIIDLNKTRSSGVLTLWTDEFGGQ